MDWSAQAQAMSQAWAETQQKMWQEWFTLAQNGSKTANPGWFEQWRTLANQGLASWLGQADPIARDTAQRIVAGQQVMLRFYEFVFEIWRESASKMEAGEAWPAALAGQVEEIRRQFQQTLAAAQHLNQDSTALWQLYLEQAQKFAQPWLQPELLSQLKPGQSPAFSKLAGLYWDVYRQTIGDFLQSPTLGYSREFEEKIRQGFAVWLECRKYEAEYQTIVAQSWLQALENFQAELVSFSRQGQTIHSLAELGTLWATVAENTFIQVFNSESYLLAQTHYLNATMRYRIQQREVLEIFWQALDLPTRSEVDQAHRANYELRKEVKTLKKSLVQLEQRQAQELAGMQAALQSLQEEVTVLKKAQVSSKRTSTTRSHRPNTLAAEGES